MKKLKKVFAVLLSVAMILGMSTTAFAATDKPAQYPNENDTGTVTVGKLNVGDEVKFYQIVKPDYSGNAVTGYSAIEFGADKVKVSNISKPSATDITSIAAVITDAITPAETKTVAEGSDSVSATLPVGTYLALVKSAKTDVVYNPMIVSSYYVVGGIRQDIVNANTSFNTDGTNAYAKSTGVTLEKTIVNPGSGNNKGDDTAFGAPIDFQIVAAVPSYSEQYTNITYKISDELVKGLDHLTGIKVWEATKAADGSVVKGTEITETVAAYEKEDIAFTDATKGNKGFVLDFKSGYIKGLSKDSAAPAYIVVEYRATLADDAGINFDKNTNEATLEYTNKPGTENNTEELKDRTYHYTFGIDAALGGPGSETWNKTTQELFKTEKIEKTESGEMITPPKPLNGAKFELRQGDEVIARATSGKVVDASGNTMTMDGALQFRGLDAGDYKLYEVEAPTGYAKISDPVDVQIRAGYKDDGRLEWYSIKIGDVTSKYVATYEDGEDTYDIDGNDDITTVISNGLVEKGMEIEGETVKTETDADGNVTTTRVVRNADGTLVTESVTKLSNTYAFENTTLGELPSTGGIGTIIFTVGGCLIMVVAAALYFANRRRSANSESK